MVQVVCIVGHRIAQLEAGLAWIDAMPNARSLRLHRAAAQWTVVHLARLIVP